MAVKYFLEYDDIEGNTHRLDIDEFAYVGAATEIQGKVFLQYETVTDPLEAIRGSSLNVELEANVNRTFIDLYSEEERSFGVTYTRDGVVQFRGFLLPDGLFQDFVNERWIISLDCVDGLGLLKNLSYVDNTGLFFLGRQNELEIIVNCLKRTGIDQEINTAINIFYTGLATNVDPLPNVFLNAERFIKEDNDTILDCDNVLRSVLEKYGACITQTNGEWYIYKPNEVFNDPIVDFFRYDSDGVYIENVIRDLSVTIGSQVNDFDIFHCNENQRIEIRPSIASFRINYKYGFAESIIANENFENDGVTIDNWNIISAPNVTPIANAGVEVSTLGIGQTATIALESTPDVQIIAGTAIQLFTIIEFFDQVTRADYRVVLEDSGSADVYYLFSDGSWIVNAPLTTVGFNSFQANPSPPPTNIAGEGVRNFQTVVSQPAPVDGDLHIDVLTPINFTVGNYTGYIRIDNLRVTVIQETQQNLQGEFHTVERTTKPSSVIKDNKEVFNGDNSVDIYIGTIYEADAGTNTQTWFREGIAEAKPILQIMGEETLRMSQVPAQLFSGDIYGFISYLASVSIDGIGGVFMPQSYRYDTFNNIISLELREVFGDEVNDIAYEKTFDYGNVVEPTIRG